MTDDVLRRAAAVSDAVADFIVNDLEWEGTKAELLGPEAVDLPAVLDSADLLELAGYLEDHFGVVIEDEEIVAENFTTVEQLAGFIVAKQSQTRGAST